MQIINTLTLSNKFNKIAFIFYSKKETKSITIITMTSEDVTFDCISFKTSSHVLILNERNSLLNVTICLYSMKYIRQTFQFTL